MDTSYPVHSVVWVSQNEDPSLVRKFVHEVGARGLEQQLRGAQEEVTRAMTLFMMDMMLMVLRCCKDLKRQWSCCMCRAAWQTGDLAIT